VSRQDQLWDAKYPGFQGTVKMMKIITITHTHTFNVPLSGTARAGRYQKGKTNLYFTDAVHSEWQWHQLGHMQVCTSLQADNHASTPPLSFFTGRMPFLPPNQQCQSIVTKLGRKLADQLDDDREISFLFQRLSVLIQWYNAILLYDCFVNDEQ